MTSISCSSEMLGRFKHLKRAYELMKKTSVENDAFIEMSLNALEKQETQMAKFAAQSSAKVGVRA